MTDQTNSRMPTPLCSLAVHDLANSHKPTTHCSQALSEMTDQANNRHIPTTLQLSSSHIVQKTDFLEFLH